MDLLIVDQSWKIEDLILDVICFRGKNLKICHKIDEIWNGMFLIISRRPNQKNPLIFQILLKSFQILFNRYKWCKQNIH